MKSNNFAPELRLVPYHEDFHWVDFSSYDSKVWVTAVNLTPDIAKAWLGKNKNVRTKSPQQIDTLAKGMLAGKFPFNHQTMCWDGDGNFFDGQNRAEAVVKANTTQRFLVVVNGRAKFDDPVDRGRVRSIADTIKREAKEVAAASLLRSLEHAKWLPYISTWEVEEILDKYEKEFTQARGLVDPWTKTTYAPLIAAYVWAAPLDKRADGFFYKAATGFNLDAGDPAWAFRSWVHEKHATRRAWDACMVALTCLRYCIAGKALFRTKVSESGYEKIASMRRGINLLYTPTADVVEAEIDARRRRQQARKEKISEIEGSSAESDVEITQTVKVRA